MKMAVIVGIVIIVISLLFVSFVSELLVQTHKVCFTAAPSNCGSEDIFVFITSLIMANVSIIIDIATIYLVFKNIYVKNI